MQDSKAAKLDCEQTRCWRIIGGRNVAGIIVRLGCELSSPKAEERLSYNAIVKELSIEGNRLHYELIEGTGPDSGWVSIKLNGNDLATRFVQGADTTKSDAKSSDCLEHTQRKVQSDPCVLPISKVEARLPRDIKETATYPNPFQRRIRTLMLSGWRMSVRGGHVSPPDVIPKIGNNPIEALGECADPQCGNYRPSAPKVRTAFAEFCITTLLSALPGNRMMDIEMAYISVGSGALYFDWELLERLHETTGMSVKRISLIDTQYARPGARLNEALRQFKSWYAAAIVQNYSSVSEFLRSEFPIAQDREAKPYQIIVQCDASQVDQEEGSRLRELRKRALQPGGLAFTLSNPPERRVWQRRVDGSRVDQIDSAVWQYPGWGHQKGKGQAEPMPC